MDELAKRFADLAEKYGPNVADAALAAARMQAYSCLAGGLLVLIVGGALLAVGIYIHRQKDWDEEWVVASLIAWFVGGIVCVVGLWSFVDPWTWTTINHPEIWIAKQAFHL